MSSHLRIAVIGAGLAGLACAQALARADAEVSVFEKSRGLGGRLATRRDDELAFDHGAQFVTAHGPAFARYLDLAERSGCAARWTPQVAGITTQRSSTWYVGLPGMSGLVQPLARGLDLRRSLRITALQRHARTWRLGTTDGEAVGAFDAVVMALPAAQASALLDESSPLAEALAGVSYAPCWAAMVAFAGPTGIAVDLLGASDAPALGWAARTNSLPGRAAAPEAWVVQATPAWTRAMLDADPQTVAARLLHELATQAGRALPPPIHLRAHRWRHARVERALGRSHLLDEGLALGYCGDGCSAARAEAAFDSGQALAAALVEQFNLPRRLAPP